MQYFHFVQVHIHSGALLYYWKSGGISDDTKKELSSESSKDYFDSIY